MPSQVIIADKKKRTGLRSVVGLVLAIAVGIIAYVLAPSVLSLIRDRYASFGRPYTDQQVTIGIAVALFFIIITIFALIVAAATPKPKLDVKETDIMKEREQMKLMQVAEKKRQQRLNRQMRQDVRERGQSLNPPPDNRR